MRRWINTFLVLCVGATLSPAPRAESADDPWLEMKSAHFQVISNAGEGTTRNLTWRLEQIRSVIAALWPWARVDLSRPSNTVVRDRCSVARAPSASVWIGCLR
jgi:hypothetical protein